MADIFKANTNNSIFYSSLLVSIPNTGYDTINILPTINISGIENKYTGSWLDQN